ncbi:MAG: endonuclease/exonuclease/phosphatase family protein [Candidatus Glassbacteria bacterium]
MNRQLLFASMWIVGVTALFRVAPCFDDDVREFKLATYNVKNLFDEHDDPYYWDEKTDPMPKPLEEVKALASVIHRLDADIIALQEVESREVLRRFRRRFLQDMGYGEPVLIEGNDMRGIDVALLSRIPVGPVTSYRHLQVTSADYRNPRFERDLLRVRMCPEDDFWFDIYVVHLKSGRRVDDIKKRMSEAIKVREILDGELKRYEGYRFILVGDFNDSRKSDVIRLIEGKGKRKLFCLNDELPEDQGFTFVWKSIRAQFDYIFCSPSMKGFYVEGSARVIIGEDVSIASDHMPVIASFSIPSK